MLAALALAWLLAQYLAWALLHPAILAAPAGPVAVGFWLAQLAGALLVAATCLVGFRPAVYVEATTDGLILRQGARRLTLLREEIDAVEVISSRRFYRHEARYAATHVFASRLMPELLLLHTLHGPVALALPPADRAALQRLIEEDLISYEMPAARVA